MGVTLDIQYLIKLFNGEKNEYKLLEPETFSYYVDVPNKNTQYQSKYETLSKGYQQKILSFTIHLDVDIHKWILDYFPKTMYEKIKEQFKKDENIISYKTWADNLAEYPYIITDHQTISISFVTNYTKIMKIKIEKWADRIQFELFLLTENDYDHKISKQNNIIISSLFNDIIHKDCKYLEIKEVNQIRKEMYTLYQRDQIISEKDNQIKMLQNHIKELEKTILALTAKQEL